MIFCSDIHLSHAPPVARSHEKDWYGCMEACLQQLANAQRTINGDGPEPRIVYCGDIFDRWNPPLELVNFAIQVLPHGLAIPGNHDLPAHRYEDKRRSAYYTLKMAGVIEDMIPGRVYGVADWNLHPFPYGRAINKASDNLREGQELCKDVAVVHAYCWVKGAGYEGAEDDARGDVWNKLLYHRCYSHGFFGDNHKDFVCSYLGVTLANCGGFMRRAADEQDHEPGFYALMRDGSVLRYAIKDGEVSREHMRQRTAQEYGAFFASLSELAGGEVDFREAMLTHLRQSGLSAGARRRVLEALGES